MLLPTFVETYLPYAQRAVAGTKISPYTVLAAAALESGSGAHAPGYNFFGIKAGSNWKGETQRLLTTEEINGKLVKVMQTFRKYSSPEGSFRDYVKVVTGARYVAAGVTGTTDPYEQIRRIHAAGYATDSHYTAKVTDLLKQMGAQGSVLASIIPLGLLPFSGSPWLLATAAAALGIGLYLKNKKKWRVKTTLPKI